ncbi:MAG: hypothetical protein WBC06_13880 [Chitinophagaceae bacterium]
MKNSALLVILLFYSFCIQSQNKAAEFEKIMIAGNSARGFEFVRNTFGIPSAQDPFLHFKERGIKQLISFYEHKDRSIEATSLIKFHQTKEFWKNYSQQFTAGKWNYKNLYKTDSLAWQAANYSITLIYAHEMGHYMSYNLVNDFSNDYTCEEVVANECLAAFANAFNGNKKLDLHKRLFLSLIKQTAALIPDSNKTDFNIPMEKWCAPNPMDNFFEYYQSDETRFLRLYGYSQFRMMEQTLSNYKGGALPDFLNKKFFNFYKTYTGAGNFKPLKYRIVGTSNFKNVGNNRIYINHIIRESGSYFNTYFLNNYKYHIGNKGQVLNSYIGDEKLFYPDTLEPNYYKRYNLVNEEVKPDTVLTTQNLIYIDSLSSWYGPDKSQRAEFDIVAAFTDTTGFYYLIKKYAWFYPANSYESDSATVEYELLKLFEIDDNYFIRRFMLPDSLNKNDRMVNQEISLTGINNGNIFLITNELTKEHSQVISMYPVNTDEGRLESAVWQGTTEKKGYFNIQYPTTFLDEVKKAINLCFWNPVTRKIYLVKIKDKGTEGFGLYQHSVLDTFGPQLKVNALRLVAPNKLMVFAETRPAGNSSKAVMQQLLLQW